ANLVPHWSTWDEFRRLEGKGLTMYGQMTAGSWCSIGSQGIVQGTYETLAAVARKHFRGDLAGRIVLSGGLGGMGGAQPRAVTMNKGVCLVVEVDPSRVERRRRAGLVDVVTDDLAEARRLAEAARKERRATAIALVGNCAEAHPALFRAGFRPDVVTDQTSAHDALHGYVPGGMSLEEALRLRRRDPGRYVKASMRSMATHCRAMLSFAARGAVAFDYGINLRGQAQAAGVRVAFSYPGFVAAYVRPLFCEGRGPFRWIALTGEPDDILETGRMVRRMFPENKALVRWIDLAERTLPWEGLPARVCWLGLGERARFARAMNRAVRDGRIGPMAITRDHLDTGSVASPYRETEGMRDGSDAIADWPLLNALLNTAAGADLVAIHNGGGVGIGLSTHAGMIVVADGSRATDARMQRVFTTDPGLGVVRHADAGYAEARRTARRAGLRLL
ncbi:MAG: urocanate hydratase, partial [Methanobacteriota archaeon]